MNEIFHRFTLIWFAWSLTNLR